MLTDLSYSALFAGLLDHVTVLIGIASGGKAVGGVIHQPYYNYQNPGWAQGRGYTVLPMYLYYH